MKRVLIACEFSGIVRQALQRQSIGAEVWSCDLLPCERESGHAINRHFQCDVRTLFDLEWDMMIAFPPCTYLAVSGARWMKNKDGSINKGRLHYQELAINFFLDLATANIPQIAIENPIGIMSTRWRKPDQIIQPWQFGHGETKATCLWLKNLPKLKPTNIVSGREPRVHHASPGPDRWKERSRTLQGIADAMADQWFNLGVLSSGEPHPQKYENKSSLTSSRQNVPLLQPQ